MTQNNILEFGDSCLTAVIGCFNSCLTGVPTRREDRLSMILNLIWRGFVNVERSQIQFAISDTAKILTNIGHQVTHLI